MDKNGAVYFMLFMMQLKFIPIFVESSQTEAGSAGEQPARDKLDG
jgi:hypothetical protein